MCVCVCVCVLCSSNVPHAYCAQELPEFWAVHLLLPTLVKRLTYASSVDLVPLQCVPACMHAYVCVCAKAQ